LNKKSKNQSENRQMKIKKHFPKSNGHLINTKVLAE